jgi:signal transduction histidine kinase
MDEETARRIFEPFYSTRVRGTGLGLAITRQLVEEAGGSISCTTTPGVGTCFTMILPAALEVEE